MNTHIDELKELFITNNIFNVKDGLQSLESFFNEFEVHPMKQEYSDLTKKDKIELVKTLLDSINNTNENTVKIDSEAIPNESSTTTPVIENDSQIEENLTDLLNEDVKALLTERDELTLKLLQVNEQLNELGYSEHVVGTTKMDKCKQWRALNPNGTRSEFMSHFSELGSKPMLSTYWQKVK